MIANLIGGFVSILVGVSLIGPIAGEVNTVSMTSNATGSVCTTTAQSGCAGASLAVTSSWGATVLRLVPGFFALGILGIGLAVTYSSLRQAGVL
jgi:hypothetical protein